LVVVRDDVCRSPVFAFRVVGDLLRVDVPNCS
jgi:hypothetical protein